MELNVHLPASDVDLLSDMALYRHFVASLVYLPGTCPKEETDCSAMPPVRVHLFPQHRRSTFLLYPPLYVLLMLIHCLI